ncbi:MAG: hypothetical protein MJ214_02145 [Bacilli bacterium]|nr:hypothetical protein [Bacilli bacterium]
MKKGLLLSGMVLISSLCLGCNKSYSINFECIHCTNITSEDKSETTFKIEFGYQLLENNIEVIHNGKLDNDCWTFMYQSNVINSFKIKPGTSGDLKVKINCTEKKLFEYGLAIDVPEVDQSSITFSPTQKDKHYIEDWQRVAYAIKEDENLDFTFQALEGKTLPTNIGMWMNGRYSREGVEVNFEYSKDLKSCHVTVPYFVVKDNLQFRLK